MTASSVYREYVPAPWLRHRVACYWTLEAAGPEPRRILPDGSMDLLFDMDSVEASGVVGAMTKPLISTFPHAAISLLGVRFQPGEAFAFLDGIPARRLRDGVVPLREFWKTPANDLSEQLATLADSPSRVKRLDEVLGTRIRERPADARLRRAVSAIAGLTPTELERAVQMSDLSNPPYGPLRMLSP
jgi:hypothetical protein